MKRKAAKTPPLPPGWMWVPPRGYKRTTRKPWVLIDVVSTQLKRALRQLDNGQDEAAQETLQALVTEGYKTSPTGPGTLGFPLPIPVGLDRQNTKGSINEILKEREAISEKLREERKKT